MTTRRDSAAVFLPVLRVEPDGTVDIDFFDSFSHYYADVDDTATFWYGGDETAPADLVRAGELLDEILGQGTTVERLRRLADHIEARGAQS